MAWKSVNPQKAAPPVGPYSHAVRTGDLLFCSGQIPLNPENPAAALPETAGEQARRVFANIGLILADQGLGFSNVVKMTVFLTDLNDFAEVNAVFAEHIEAPYPARSTIQVSALPRGARVEIEAIASFC